MPLCSGMRSNKRDNCHSENRRSAQYLVSALASLSFLAAASTVHAQLPPQSNGASDLHSGHDVDQTFEPLVDGSAEPEKIPDSLAIRALMQTLQLSADPDNDALTQLRIRTGRMELAESDFNILVAELGVLDRQAKAAQARIETIRQSAAANDRGPVPRALRDQYVEEQNGLTSLMEAQFQRLLDSLSPEGAAKLQTHLEHVKSRIRIYPTPVMSTQTP